MFFLQILVEYIKELKNYVNCVELHYVSKAEFRAESIMICTMGLSLEWQYCLLYFWLIQVL